YLSGEIRAQPQDHQKASLAPRITKEDGQIDWSESAIQVHNRIRACNPWPGASATFRGQPLKIWESRLVPGRSAPADMHPGEVAQAKAELTVCCPGQTLLRLTVVQPPNRKRLTASDFINGFQPRIGESLGGG
ncbi:MAG: methionyl-tRNA formyltransferase, partial [Acidobacteriota bacterium]